MNERFIISVPFGKKLALSDGKINLYVLLFEINSFLCLGKRPTPNTFSLSFPSDSSKMKLLKTHFHYFVLMFHFYQNKPVD